MKDEIQVVFEYACIEAGGDVVDYYQDVVLMSGDRDLAKFRRILKKFHKKMTARKKPREQLVSMFEKATGVKYEPE